MIRSTSSQTQAAQRASLKDLFARWWFMTPAALLLLVTLAYPIGYTVYISFAEINLGTFRPQGWVGWNNYLNVLEDDRFRTAIVVTAKYLVFALPLQLVSNKVMRFKRLAAKK